MPINKSKQTTVKLDMHNRCTPSEIERVLKMQLHELFKHPEDAFEIPPVMIWGPPGAGKSSVIKQVAEDENIDLIDFRLSQVEPVDLRGLPVPNKEDKSVEWYVSGEFPRSKDSRGILLFDEISAADRSLQVAAYQLILDRCLGKLYKLPPGWLIVAAGNRTEDRAVSTTMSSALANRFLHFEMEPNRDNWLDWAQTHDIHPAIQGFIRYRPEYLFMQDHQNLERGWPSPRSWAKVSKMCHIYNEKNDTLLRKIVFGLVGNGAGVEFMAFWHISSKFDDVLEYMTNPSKQIVIPTKNDEKHALCAAVSYLLWRGADELDEKNRINGFFRIAMELTPDFSTMLMNSALLGKDKKLSGEYAEKLFMSPLYKDWSDKFGKAFKKRAII